MKSSQAKKEFEQKLETLRTEVQPALTENNLTEISSILQDRHVLSSNMKTGGAMKLSASWQRSILQDILKPLLVTRTA